MKRLALLLTALLCFGISYCQQLPKPADFKKLYWLEGTWMRTNVKPGQSGNEHWIKISPTELQGTGITMRGRDTAFREKFKLVIKDTNIYYVADVPENKQPVEFKLTQISEKAFTCENPEHDFPKMITYRRDGNIIKATISGDGKSFEYLFEKK